MLTEKLFTVAGIATDKGITKVRFANDLVARIKILNKAGCTNINLFELSHPMTKLQALQHMQAMGTFEGDAAEAISTKMSEKVKVAKRAEVRVVVNPSSMSKSSVDAETA
jgi:hypothetical protein